MGRRLQRLPVVLHELHPAGELPGCGCGVLAREGTLRPVPAGTSGTRGAVRVPRGVPRAGRPCRRRPPGGGRVRMARPAEVALAVGGVRPVVPGDGGDRVGRGAGVRAVRVPRGLPAGHPGQHPGDRGVLGARLPPGLAVGVGARRRGRVGGTERPAPDRRPRGHRGGDRRARGAVVRAADALVALSTDHHLAAGRRRHRDRRQRPPASTDHVGVLHGDRAGVPFRAVRALAREPAHERVDRRCGQRERRRDRPRAGSGPRRRRRDRPRAVCAGSRPAPRSSVRGPEGGRLRRGRSCVHPRHRHDVRPGDLRDPGFTRRARRPVVAAPRELPVHRGGGRGGARPPRARWSGGDVPLLPAGRSRSLRRHARPNVRRAALPRPEPRPGRAPANGAHREQRSRQPGVSGRRGNDRPPRSSRRPTISPSRTWWGAGSRPSTSWRCC